VGGQEVKSFTVRLENVNGVSSSLSKWEKGFVLGMVPRLLEERRSKRLSSAV
jgi:hypothetical protein